jgi:hypothetical protein
MAYDEQDNDRLPPQPIVARTNKRHHHQHFMANLRAKLTAEGWRVDARYVVRGHTIQTVLTRNIDERKASALGVPRKGVLGIKVLLRTGGCRPSVREIPPPCRLEDPLTGNR